MTRRRLSSVFALLGLLFGGFFLTAAAPADSPGVATSIDPLPPELRAWAEQHGAIRVGYFPGGAPVGIVEDGEVTGGWAFELYRLMGIKLGVDIEHVVLPSPAALTEALREGSIDIVGAAGARPDLVAFAERTRPLSWTPLVFIGGSAQQAIGVEALTARTVSTIAGSPIVARLADQFPEATYVETASIAEGLQSVADGQIDLYLGPLAIVGYNLQLQGLSLGPVGDPIDVIEVPGWGVAGSPALDVINLGREQLTDAELSVVHVRWTGFDLGNPVHRTNPWIMRSLWVTLGIVLLLTGLAQVLRRRVAAATADLHEANEQLEVRVEERTVELAEANGRLRRTNTALNSFAKTAAHDLRGPITAIAGLSQQLLRTLELPNDKRDELLDTIRSSSVRLSDMIETMLDDALQAGAVDPSLTGEEFSPWLDGVVAPEVQAVGATVEIEVPPGTIGVDAAVLRRCAVNLVGNALKYAANDDGTAIRVVLRPSDDATWELTVDDNGPGIPSALWGKIFEKGFQADAGDGGRGFGLAGIRHQVQRLGGSIRVGDSPAGGARFVVLLPALESSDGTEMATARASA